MQQEFQKFDKQKQELIIKFEQFNIENEQQTSVNGNFVIQNKLQQQDSQQTNQAEILNKLQQQVNGFLSVQNQQSQYDLSIVKELSDTKSYLQKIYSNQVEYQQKLDNIYGNSAKKGQQAEQIVEQSILNQYPQAVITNTSKLTNSGDLLVTLNNKRILIEVKNYGSTVPQKEVDKFINDINTTQCDCGIFVSFGQRIVNKPRICYETSQQNKQLIYISQQENSDLILVLIEMLLQYNETDQQTLETLKRQKKAAQETINETIKQVKKQKLQTEKQVKELTNLLNQLMQIENSIINSK